jgi:hypothetical protein
VADDVEGEISKQVGEEVPSPVPTLHMGSADFRLCLIGDGKHRSESTGVGGGRPCDVRWRAELLPDDHKTWGKRSTTV